MHFNGSPLMKTFDLLTLYPPIAFVPNGRREVNDFVNKSTNRIIGRKRSCVLKIQFRVFIVPERQVVYLSFRGDKLSSTRGGRVFLLWLTNHAIPFEVASFVRY